MKKKIAILLVLIMLLNTILPVFALESDTSTVFVFIEDNADTNVRKKISYGLQGSMLGYFDGETDIRTFDKSEGIAISLYVDDNDDYSFGLDEKKLTETLFLDTTSDFHSIKVIFNTDSVEIVEITDIPTHVILEHSTLNEFVAYLEEDSNLFEKTNHILIPGDYDIIYAESTTTSSGGISLTMVDETKRIVENQKETLISNITPNMTYVVSTSMGAIDVRYTDIAYNGEDTSYYLGSDNLVEFNTNSDKFSYLVTTRIDSDYMDFIIPSFQFEYSSAELVISQSTIEEYDFLSDVFYLEDANGNKAYLSTRDDLIEYTLSNESGIADTDFLGSYSQFDATPGIYDLTFEIPSLGLSATKEITITGYVYTPTVYENYLVLNWEHNTSYEGEYLFRFDSPSHTITYSPYVSSYFNKDVIFYGFDSTDEFTLTVILDENDDGELNEGETSYLYTDDGTRNLNDQVVLNMNILDDNITFAQNTIDLAEVKVLLNDQSVSMMDVYGKNDYYGGFSNEFDYLAVPGEYDINYIDNSDVISIYYTAKEVAEGEISIVELTDTPLTYTKDISITTGSDYTFDSVSFRGVGSGIYSSHYFGQMTMDETTSLNKTVHSSIELLDASIYLEFGNNSFNVDIPYEYLDQAVFNEGTFAINAENINYGTNRYKDFLSFNEGDKSYVVDFSMNDVFIEIYNSNNELVYGKVNWFVYDFVTIGDNLVAGDYTLKMFSKDMLFDIESKFTLTAETTSPPSSGSGGGTSAPSTPTTPLDDETEETVSEIEELINNGETNELADKTSDLIDGIDETSADVNEQISEISETVAAVVESVETEEAVSIVNDLVNLANEAMDNLEADEASKMATDIIETAFNALTNKENVDLTETKAAVGDMVEKVIGKAATVELGNNNGNIVIESKLLLESLENIETFKDNLADTLEEHDLTDVTDKMEDVIIVTIPESVEGAVSFDLDEDAIDVLNDSEYGLVVETEGVNITLPTELLNGASESITIKSKPVTEKLANDTQGGKVTELQTLDLNVEVGDESVKGLVELSFSLKDLEDVDLDTLMVGVYENGEWTKLNYEIKGNKVYFTAPHFSIYSLLTYESSFEDIEGNWAKESITSLAAKGIISGRDDVTFDPNNTISRAEFMALLVNYLGLEGEAVTNYSDVTEDVWYYDIIGLGTENGILAGNSEHNFRPNDNITREEMTVMLMQAFEIKHGYALEGGPLSFADTNDISEYALGAVSAAKSNNIVSGYLDNTFKPQETATRAEAATIIYYFLKK